MLGFGIKRIAFIGIGSLTGFSAYMAEDWVFAGIGAIFALMGILGRSCAGSPCTLNDNNSSTSPTKKFEKEIEFEEIK